MVQGDSYRGRASRRIGQGMPINYSRSYSGYSKPPWETDRGDRAISRQARATHNFDEIILATRVEAETTLEQLYDVIAKYQVVSVADMYEMVGAKAYATDNKWGWTDLRGAGVQRIREGYLLNLPKPEPIES